MTKSRVEVVTEVLKYTKSILNSGSNLPGGLQSLANREGDSEVGRLARSLAGELERGGALGDALERACPGTDPLTLTLIRTGEEGGNLHDAVDALLMHRRNTRQIEERIQAATFYPRVIIFLFLVILLPIMAWVYSEIAAQLPDQTFAFADESFSLKTVIRMMTSSPRLLLVPYMFGWPVWLAISICSFLLLFRPVGPFKHIATHMVNAMYLVGPMARNQQAASFAGALGLMTKANIDLETAMGHLIAFTSNPITRQDLIVVKGQIERGLSLSESLSGCKSFPQSLPWFVALGERGDNLTGTLMSTEEFYRTETNNLLGFISTSLEPLLIFTMGIPFGALAVSIFLPMLRLINNVG